MFNVFTDEPSHADYYIDLGTANILIASRKDGIIVNEPTIIAYSEVKPGKKKIVAVGLEAKDKFSKTPGNISMLRPLRDGVIADFDTTEAMLKYYFEKLKLRSFMKKPRVVISLPYGATEVEKQAVVDAGESAGAKEVHLIDEPMAAAIGAELPIKEARGSMIIDIGGGTTEVAVVALSDIVYCQAIRMGGNKFDESIVDYFRKKKNLIISESTAEQLKINYGTATPKKDILQGEVTGRDYNTGLNRTISFTSEDIGNAMDDNLRDIINVAHLALENTPPELVSDIMESGIVVSGGGGLIRDLDIRLQNEIRLPVRISPEPLTTIARGGREVLSDMELLFKIQLEY